MRTSPAVLATIRRTFSDPRVAIAVLVGAIACTEPRDSATPSPTPAPALEARVELSDSVPRAGDVITVSIRLSGSLRDRVASFTSRVAYDTTGLRFLDEIALTDGATRVSNPLPGLLRTAGLSVRGFGDAPLGAFHFQVLRASSLASLRLSMDELHEIDRTDASRTLTIGGARVGGPP